MSHLSYFGGAGTQSKNFQNKMEEQLSAEDIAKEILYDIVNLLLDNFLGEDTLLKNEVASDFIIDSNFE